MKIVKSERIISLIKELENINEINISISELFLDVVGRVDVTSQSEMATLTKKFNLPENELYLSKLGDYLEIDWESDENKEMFESLIKPYINKADSKKYLNNPYYKTIKTNNVKDGKYELIIDRYQPYELFALKDLSFKDNYETNSFGYFSEEFPFIALNEKGVTWMSITPNEIETMEKAIESAKENVIVFGLGLGYYPFMVSLKPEVKKITIIESDQHIIDLFKKHLLPQFPNKEKINIVKGDAFEHIKEVKNFDTAFVDLWHDPEDGIESYLKFKRGENEFGNCIVSYWIESSFIALLRRCMITLLVEQNNGFTAESYAKSEGIIDNLINRYYRNTKNLTLSSEDEILDLLKEKSLIKFIS